MHAEQANFRLYFSEIRKIKIFENFLPRLFRIKNQLERYAFQFQGSWNFKKFQREIPNCVLGYPSLKIKTFKNFPFSGSEFYSEFNANKKIVENFDFKWEKVKEFFRRF